MREPATRDKIKSLMDYIGRRAKEEATVYLCSGTSIVWWGLRDSSLDVDLKVEGTGIGPVIREAKEELNINIEPEHPGLFIPLLPGWKGRSQFIQQAGPVQFYHLDPYSVVLSKLDRYHEKDVHDIQALVNSGRVEPMKLHELFRGPDYQEKLQEKFDIEIESLHEKVSGLANEDA